MSSVLKKEQVLAELRKRLQNGEIPPGSKLKSGVQLAQEFNVSHITIRSVLRELSLAGELVVVHGRGTFAPEAPVRIAPKILVIRLGAGFEHPGHYIMPEFIARTNELGGSVTEINVQFIRNNPSETMVTVLRNSGYTGVLLDGSSYTGKEPELRVLRQLNLPVILSHANSQDAQITGYPALGCNLKQAWKDGLESICATGRKRIALLLCPHGRNIYRGRTIEEHLQLLKECGADSDPDLIEICANVSAVDYDQSISDAVEKLLSLPNKPEAIYCFSDFLALKAYSVIKDKKLRIPEDIAVMGFCGYPGGSLLKPALATVDEDYAAHGRIAAEKLCAPEQWFKNSSWSGWHEIPHKVCCRASIGKKMTTKS